MLVTYSFYSPKSNHICQLYLMVSRNKQQCYGSVSGRIQICLPDPDSVSMEIGSLFGPKLNRFTYRAISLASVTDTFMRSGIRIRFFRDQIGIRF